VSGQGRALSAHGTTEMPVWGPMFRMFESDARVRERIENLVTHLESLQRPTTAAGDPGAQAFHTYCASCHGTSASRQRTARRSVAPCAPRPHSIQHEEWRRIPERAPDSHHRWPRRRVTWRPCDASLGRRIHGLAWRPDSGTSQRSNRLHREVPERDPGAARGVGSQEQFRLHDASTTHDGFCLLTNLTRDLVRVTLLEAWQK
jgi:hypothetical protein